MKFKLVTLGFLSASACLTVAPAFTTDALAQCVITDVSVQAAIHGSHHPAQQTNNTDMPSVGSCVGNTSTSTSAQVYAGSADKVVQERTSTHEHGGGRGNGTGVEGPTVAVPVQVKVDVYNPAYDSSFMHNLKATP